MLTRFINPCWAGFQIVKSKPYVVSNSIPILWFGDLDAYKKSDLKIITVCTHPSYYEFADKTRIIGTSMRFPDAASLVGNSTLNPSEEISYKSALDNYFKNKGTHGLTYYKKWFNHFEKVLNGVDASYFTGERKRTSIHIDYYTPVVVKEWNKNSKSAIRDWNATKGYSFEDLVNALNPDVIIACLDKKIISSFEDIHGLPCDSKNAITHFSPKSIKSVYIRSFKLKNKGNTLANRILIWGNNGDVPFARIGYADIAASMGDIKGKYHL